MTIDLKNKIFLMLDLETLGTNAKAPVVQISMGVFSLDKGISPSFFNAQIDFDKALKYGEADSETIKWWFKQSDDARANLIAGKSKPKTALLEACKFIKSYKLDGYFAHAAFDFPIFNSLCLEHNIDNPFDYRKQYDLRTLELLSPKIEFGKREGTHHNALDDVKYQIENALKMLEAIENKQI